LIIYAIVSFVLGFIVTVVFIGPEELLRSWLSASVFIFILLLLATLFDEIKRRKKDK